MRFFIASQLSPHIAETPEGYLLCRDVPIARTGEMLYGPDEVPLEAGSDGLVHIIREPEDVFDPVAVCSFEGKPGTIDHPDEDVTPTNWRKLAIGHAQNVRRGEGDAADLLLADLLITEQEAIGLVRGGLREISCGYDADYEQTAPGRGRQRNIRGNHIALVRNGRCGPRCRIKDNQEDGEMTKQQKKTPPEKRSFRDRFMDWLKTPDAAKVLDGMEEEPSADPEQPAPTDAEPNERLDKLESQLGELAVLVRSLAEKAQDEETGAEDGDPDDPAQDEGADPEAPAKTGDAARKPTRDTRTVDADTMARAALLSPDLRVATTDNRCVVQRQALRTASKDAALGRVVSGALQGSTLDDCDCVTLDAAFVAASEVARAVNNGKTVDGLTKATAKDFGRPRTPAEINEANRKFHDNKGGK